MLIETVFIKEHFIEMNSYRMSVIFNVYTWDRQFHFNISQPFVVFICGPLELVINPDNFMLIIPHSQWLEMSNFTPGQWGDFKLFTQHAFIYMLASCHATITTDTDNHHHHHHPRHWDWQSPKIFSLGFLWKYTIYNISIINKHQKY